MKMATDLHNLQKVLPSVIAVTQTMKVPAMWLGESGMLLNVNPACCAHFGYSRQNFRHQNMFQLNPGMTSVKWDRLWGNLLNNGVCTFDIPTKREKGIFENSHFSGVLMRIAEHPVCFATYQSKPLANHVLHPDRDDRSENGFHQNGHYPNGHGNFASLKEAQRQHIIAALRRCNGKVSGSNGAAELLKINDKTLFSRMKKLGINKKTIFK